MQAHRIDRAFTIACALLGPLFGLPAAAAPLTRVDAPVVVQQLHPSTNPIDAGYATGTIAPALPAALLGIAPADLVAFRRQGTSWVQIPVQVDERKSIDLNDVYTTRPGCSDPCYNNTFASAVHLEYADFDTFVGLDGDATLDADDEIAFMASDAGEAVAPGSPAPAGVNAASAVEVRISDPIDSGVGYVYLFESTSGLDPAAGTDYVSYDFLLVNGPYGVGSYAPSSTAPGGMNFGPRPETSSVTTTSYQRGFTDRWYDNELRVLRGGSTGVDILDRHDAQFDDRDFSCARTQATFRAGEGAFVANIDGPVRAIRDFIGANSGPHVQRQHVFYSSLEVINTYLRVHPIPGVIDFFDYSASGLGLTYENGVLTPLDAIVPGTPEGGVVIDGVDDQVAGLGASGLDAFETVDGPQGALSMPQRLLTNNPDSTYRVSYRDGSPLSSTPCTGDDEELYGASGGYLNSAVANSDEGNALLYGGGSYVNLYHLRQIYYEEPGQADGPKRVRELAQPLELTLQTLPEPGVAVPLLAGAALLARLARRRG